MPHLKLSVNQRIKTLKLKHQGCKDISPIPQSSHRIILNKRKQIIGIHEDSVLTLCYIRTGDKAMHQRDTTSKKETREMRV